MPLINLIAPHELTARQREVLALYAHGKTQVQIARYLGIRQPTVNEHLFGKKRNGRWVGGALPKLRGALVRIFKERGVPYSETKAINLLDAILRQHRAE